MINVNDIKQFIDYVANKEQSGTSYTINELNIIFQAANIDLFKLRYGLPEEYTPGMPIPRMSYQNTQKITDDLRACKQVLNISVSAQGEMLLPSDYVHETAITYTKYINSTCGEAPTESKKPVDIIDDDKWAERCSNSIKFPSLDFPIANFLKDRIRLMPKNLGTVELSYLSVPTKPIWAFTTVSGLEIYDATNSVNFDWNDILFTDVSKLVLGYIAINLRDDELKQAIETYKKKGV
jgi:hypothetical protein